MRVATGVNAVLALVLEVALLAAAVAVGLLLPAPLPVRIAAAVVLPLAIVAVWASWLAPRAPRRLGARGRLLLQVALFATAVLGLAAAGAVGWALVLALLVAVRVIIGVRLGLV